MKKKRIILMAAVLTMSLVACAKTDSADHTTDTEHQQETVAVSSALEVLQKVWAAYEEEDKPIVMGGDVEHLVDGAPGAYDLQDLDGIDSYFHMTAEAVAMTDEAASAVHAMNANTFTSSVFHVTDAANVEAFVSSVKESVLSTRWMCGFPEKLVMISVNDNYVISAFGNGDMMDLFRSKVEEVYGNAAVVLVEEMIE